jgi:preprotein translocase subunit SecG
MVQNPKGGGLDGSFGGGGGQLGGVQSTNKFLDTATWTLAISLFALILLSNFAIPRERVNSDTNLKETISDVEVKKDAPADTPITDAPVSSDKSK